MGKTALSIFGTAPPPRAKDVVFRADADFGTNAGFAHWGDVDWAYSTGFRLAAQRLVKRACKDVHEQDVLIFPIVYLYRHHVEVALKRIANIALVQSDRPPSDIERQVLGRHELVKLWQTAEPLIDSAWKLTQKGPLPAEDRAGITSYLHQLHELDPDGQRFRYAFSKAPKGARPGLVDLKPSLRLDLIINVRVFANAMERLSDYLQGIELSFADQQDSHPMWIQYRAF